MPRRCQGTCADVLPSLMSSSSSSSSQFGLISDQLRSIANGGWSVPGTTASSNRGDYPTSDDQPLDLSSMKRKRVQDSSASGNNNNNTEPDCPLDLSTKKRKTEVEGQQQQQQQQKQQQQVVGQGNFGNSCYPLRMPAAIQEQTGIEELLGSVLRQGSVLVPPMIVGGMRLETKNHQRQRPGSAVPPPRLPYVAGSPFQLFPCSVSSSAQSHVQPMEVPVIKSVASLQHAFLATSGSRSGTSGYSSVESNAITTNPVVANADAAANQNQYSLSYLQQQQQQQLQAQRQRRLLNGCNQADNVAKLPETETTLSRDQEKETRAYCVTELTSQFRSSHSSAKKEASPMQKQPHQLLQQSGSVVRNPTVNFPGCTGTSIGIPQDHSFAANSTASLLLHSVRPSFVCSQKNPRLSRNTTTAPQPLCSGTGVRQVFCPPGGVESPKVLDSEGCSIGGSNHKGFTTASTSNAHQAKNIKKSPVDGECSGDLRSKTPLAAELEDTNATLAIVRSNACSQTLDPDRKPSNEKPEVQTTTSSGTKVDETDLKEPTSNPCDDGEGNSAEYGRILAVDLKDSIDSKWSHNASVTSLSDSVKTDLSDKSYTDAGLSSDKTKDKYDETVQNDDIKPPAASSSSSSSSSSSTTTTTTTSSGFVTVGGEVPEVIGSSAQSSLYTGCEECRRKHNVQQETVLIPSSCPKLPTPCAGDCCEGGVDGRPPGGLPPHKPPTAFPGSGGGEVIPRSCRLFDRQAPRRVPVANVQPFMKDEVVAAAAKASVGPSGPVLQAKPDANGPATEADSTIPGPPKDEENLKELPTFNRNTPHHMEFVRFLGMKVESDEKETQNPFRTPVEKLRGRPKSCDDEGSLDGDDDGRGRVRRRLRLHLTAPKRCKKYPTSDGRREGSLLGFESMKKTPIEYFDDDSAVETTQEKTASARVDGEAAKKKKQLRKIPCSVNENDDLHSNPFCQTTQSSDPDDRIMAAPLPGNRSDTTSRLADGQRSDDVTGIAAFRCSEIAGFEKRKTKGNGRDALCGGRLGDEAGSTAAPSTGETRSDPGDSASLHRPTAKRKYRRRKTLVADSERRDNGQWNQSISNPVIDSPTSILANSSVVCSSNSLTLTSSLSSSSSSSVPEVTPTKKRKRVFEDARSRDATAAVDDALSADPPDVQSILSGPRFQCVTSAPEITTCRKRGRGATVRRGGVLRNARRGGTACDRPGDYGADRAPPAEAHRRLVSRGHRRGPRHGTPRLPPPHPPPPTPRNGDFYSAAAAEGENGAQPGFQRPDCYRFDFDEIGEPFEAKCRGKDRGRIGRISSFPYPEVFGGRRRARAGAPRGRSRSTRGSLVGPGPWTHDDATIGHGTTGGTHDATTVYRCRNDGGVYPGASPLPPPASVRGKVRSRVRMAGRGSRGHRGARLGSFVVAGNGPSTSAGHGRDASETRLHQVARLGYDELVSYYLTTGIIHPNVQDNSGVTPLHDSCSSGHLNITRMLLDHGAHPNSKTVDGTRPLHLAIANDRIAVVRMLLSYGADIAMTNSAGRSPVQMAKTKEMKQMLKGFISDLSSGKVKELPWQFPASFEVKNCDILLDAPSDEDVESTEIDFDLEEDSSPLVHRFASDPQKGLRNFHAVSDLCRDVQVDDFLLLNGDLTYVHISAPLQSDAPLVAPADPSQQPTVRGPDRATPAPSSSVATPPLQHPGPLPTPGSYQRVLGPDTERSSFVEIDSNLKELLEMCVCRIPAFANRPKSSSSSAGIPARKKSHNEGLGLGPLGPLGPLLVPAASVVGCDAHGEPRASVTPAGVPVSSSFSDPFSCASTISTAKVIPEDHADPDLKDSSPRSGTSDVKSSSETNASVDERPEVKDIKRLSFSHPPPPPLSLTGISASSPCLPHPLPLLPPLSDSVVGDARVALESCRILLSDIGASKSSARKELERGGGTAASVSSQVEEGKTEEEDEEEEEGQGPFHDANDETASARPSSPEMASKDGVERHLLDPTGQRSSAGHGCSASPQQQQQHPCPATFSGDARRRPVVIDHPADAGCCSSSSTSVVNSSTPLSASSASSSFPVATAAPSSSDAPPISIPVLEKHGSGDEVVPVPKDKDEGGEEREMPQLTLYA